MHTSGWLLPHRCTTSFQRASTNHLGACRKGIVTLDHNGELPAPSQNYSSQEVLHKDVANLSVSEKYGPRTSNGIAPPEKLIMHPRAKEEGGRKVTCKGKLELSPVHRYTLHVSHYPLECCCFGAPEGLRCCCFWAGGLVEGE